MRPPEGTRGKDSTSDFCGLDEEPMGMAKTVLAPMRQALDEANWNSKGELDYFAVLLIQIRMKLGENYLRDSGKVVQPGEVAQAVDGWFPWREEEKSRRFRSGYPDLWSLWQSMKAFLDQGMGLKELVDLVNSQKTAGPELTPGTLTQW
ncbi:MAG: hypothetical protein ACKO23_06800, partial [Gemmataceae bacterium]